MSIDRRALLQALAGLPFVASVAPVAAHAAAPQVVTLTSTTGLASAALVMVCAMADGSTRRVSMTRNENSEWVAPVPEDATAVNFEYNIYSATSSHKLTVTLEGGPSKDDSP